MFFFRWNALNFGLGGWFVELTPKQLIEGYVDPVMEKMSKTPLYLGGDMTLNPWVSIDNYPATAPPNA